MQNDKVNKDDADISEFLDVPGTLSRLGTGEAVYLSLLEILAEQLGEPLFEYADGCDEETAQQAARKAHSLKGTSGNMGATKLYETLIAFEQALASHSGAQKLYNELKETYEQTGIIVAEYLKNNA